MPETGMSPIKNQRKQNANILFLLKEIRVEINPPIITVRPKKLAKVRVSNIADSFKRYRFFGKKTITAYFHKVEINVVARKDTLFAYAESSFMSPRVSEKLKMVNLRMRYILVSKKRMLMSEIALFFTLPSHVFQLNNMRSAQSGARITPDSLDITANMNDMNNAGVHMI